MHIPPSIQTPSLAPSIKNSSNCYDCRLQPNAIANEYHKTKVFPSLRYFSQLPSVEHTALAIIITTVVTCNVKCFIIIILGENLASLYGVVIATENEKTTERQGSGASEKEGTYPV